MLAQCTDLGLATSQTINKFDPHPIKKINQTNKQSTKGINISAGDRDITRPESRLKMAPSMSGKYWVNMIHFVISAFEVKFCIMSVCRPINSTRGREDIA